jgi:hypothetical protein
MADVRKALLEADVHVAVVDKLCESVLSDAVGRDVTKSLTPGQEMIGIVHRRLVELLGGSVDESAESMPGLPPGAIATPTLGAASPIMKVSPGPTIIMMCGLQGSGKTTTCGKLAAYLKKRGRSVMLAAADLQRPAAVEQLETVSKQVQAEMALDAAGQVLAVRLTSFAHMGAYLATVAPLMATGNFVKNVQANYATPLIEVITKSVLTNTTPVSAYRGAGRPEGNYFMERLFEQAATETGHSAIALRRLNHIAPDAFPFSAPSGSVYDSGDFSAVMDAALAAADWDGFAARQAESAGESGTTASWMRPATRSSTAGGEPR